MSSINASTLRLTGMSSGLDTDSMVKSLLEVDQLKVDKQFRLTQKLEWTGDAYREVNTSLKNFRQQYMSVLNSASNMYSSATYQAFSVNMQTETSAVSVTVGSSAAEGSMTINSITQLAKAAATTGTSIANASTTSSTLLQAFGEDAFDEDGNISFSINGEDFTFASSTTIGSMISGVNSNTDAGVTMNFSSLKNSFTITGKQTGYDNTFEIENLSGKAFAATAADSAFKIAEGTYRGQNAKCTIEGIDVEKSTNSFTIDGISYSLKSESTSAIQFSVERDVDAVYDKVVSFVDAYNTLIEDLQGKLDEKIYSDYEPLTDTEREKLSADQADKWDEKSKSGLLNSDSGIRTFLQNMRNAFYQTVADTGKSAASIGLETATHATTGKIVIDKDKLREAIASNPDEVARIFTNVSNSTDATTKTKESGLIVRLSATLNSYVQSSTENTLSVNSDALNEANDRLGQLEEWLSDNETKYWSKFSAMESALSKLNSQQSWLSSLLGS